MLFSNLRLNIVQPLKSLSNTCIFSAGRGALSLLVPSICIAQLHPTYALFHDLLASIPQKDTGPAYFQIFSAFLCIWADLRSLIGLEFFSTGCFAAARC
jgi:hypothetical protein